MYLLVELSKIICALDDEKFSQYQDSFPLFQRDFPLLGTKWEEFIEKQRIKSNEVSKKWSQTLREIRFWEEQELDYMYQRVMALSRKLVGKNSYFVVQTLSGKSTVPDRTTMLNRVMELAQKLLSEIYPSIMRLLNYRVNQEEIISHNIQGTVNWNKTICNAIKSTGGIPTQFVCVVPRKTFSTTENLLLLLAVKWLHRDCIKISNFQIVDNISAEERKKIWLIINSTQRILDSPLFHEIEIRSEILQAFSNPTVRIKDLLDMVEKEIQLYKTNQGEYLPLIEWMRNYVDFNMNRYQDLANFTFENIEDFDTMFELWILFEFVNHMKKYNNTNSIPIIKKNKLKGFKIQLDEKELFLYHEKYYRVPIGKKEGLNNPQNQINPDFTIEFGDKCICGHSNKIHHYDGIEYENCSFYEYVDSDNTKNCECDSFQSPVQIVLDAKNWRNSNRMEAVQKMSWYLVQMNKYKTKTGILFFSNFEKNQDPAKPMTDNWGPITVNQGNWEFVNFVIKSSRKEIHLRQLEEIFGSIMNKIIL